MVIKQVFLPKECYFMVWICPPVFKSNIISRKVTSLLNCLNLLHTFIKSNFIKFNLMIINKNLLFAVILLLIYPMFNLDSTLYDYLR